ncbi:MAG: arginine--tRNA ligase [Bacteroidetes bacterium]|nr:MAG: arginine--tRNA ligase [Bacteroidota bacterium]
MNITKTIQEGVVKAVKSLYDADIEADSVAVNTTRPDFEGEYTVVTFPFSKIARKKPQEIGEDIGKFLEQELEEVVRYNTVQGFLNLVIADNWWKAFLDSMFDQEKYGYAEPHGHKVMVEFSSPNTNKPLHLGHIRNILLGWSTYKIMTAAGYDVIRTQVVNDRGIAICRSMVAWKNFGEGKTPESTGIKGDHFVGNYYVEFAKRFEDEYAQWLNSAAAEEVYKHEAKDTQTREVFFKKYKNTYFNKQSELGKQAREMLIAWEAGDPEVRALWEEMNGWVYKGFDVTYENLGVEFDKLYHESDTYLLGKEIIESAIEKGIMHRDGKRVWADFEAIGLEPKTVIKSDGTSTYTSQDMGTARLRYDDYGVEKMVYVVADEQNDHFKGLFHILKMLDEPYADGLYHLSYGMIDLTTGKMKSREGKIVDADDLMKSVIDEAMENSKERDTTSDLSETEQKEVVRKIGMAALKFFIIKVNPKKRMTFDPHQSLDFQGQTGPYVQNAYVRTRSVLRKAGDFSVDSTETYDQVKDEEKSIIIQLQQFPELVQSAAENYDPSDIANYCYNLAKSYHRFFHECPILKAETEAAKAFRLKICVAVGNTLKTGMDLLGIEMPERM